MNAYDWGELDFTHDHVEEVHSNTPRRLRPPKLSCPVCRARKVDLIAHIRSVHPGTKVSVVQGRIYCPNELDCPECGLPMELRASKYGHGKVFYSCLSAPMCSGAHASDRFGKPKGEPADHHTKQLREAAESMFTSMWKGANPVFRNRRLAFRWLRQALGTQASHIHIKRLDGETCKRLIEAAWEYRQAA